MSTEQNVYEIVLTFDGPDPEENECANMEIGFILAESPEHALDLVAQEQGFADFAALDARYDLGPDSGHLVATLAP